MSQPAHNRDAARPNKSELRRRAILEAALSVIADGGLDAVTHRRVAAAAGVPLGSTTYYFATREELIRQAFRHYLSGATRMMDRLSTEFSEATVDGVVGYLEELVRRESAAPERVRAEYELILAAARDPELAADLRAWEDDRIAQCAGSLAALGAEHPVEAARSVLQLTRGFELECLTRPDADPKEFGRRMHVLIQALTRA